MLPFTRDGFFEVFAAYNAMNWPAAILAELLRFGVTPCPPSPRLPLSGLMGRGRPH
ncbi:hypothetical protein [Brevundimonas sp.]|uniref:hypothetical protein n=1 Tax=Brevundimonas sp. TaxID=1871086 RepID=UPI00286B9CC9|nr:hypothetical protein [Brevundimonas sp.]